MVFSVAPLVSSTQIVTQYAIAYSSVLSLPIVTKTTEVFLNYSALFKAGGLWFSGVNDVVVHGVNARQNLRRRRLSRCFTPRTLAVKVRKAETHIFRGALFLGSGMLVSWMAFHSLRQEQVNLDFTLANSVCNTFLLIANSVTLYHNIQQYQEAREKMLSSRNKTIFEESFRLMRSAFLGIVSSLGNIFVTGCNVIGMSATFIFVIGCLATATGFLKVLYDYLSRKKEKESSTASSSPTTSLVRKFKEKNFTKTNFNLHSVAQS